MPENAFLELIVEMERIRLKIQELRDSNTPGVDNRSLSIAITELETSQLWVANANRVSE